MGVGVSILLVATGAILTWAVTAEVEGLDITIVGVILLIVGLLGLALSLIFWQSWGGVHRRAEYIEGGPVRRRAAGPRRRVVVEEDDLGPGPPGPPVP